VQEELPFTCTFAFTFTGLNTMPTPKTLQKQTILDDLVNQFADPLSFFRELIQNAVDAGSGQIDVYFDFQTGEDPGSGTMVVHVDDFGEGMTREIIETKLTRLFSSAKDDDYTKIGKFGIGFVSVFAIAPDAVCVDTGRTGESWRVLFSKDKTYELFDLDRPVEGTQIRLIKQTSREKFDDFVERAREVILQWCKHVPVPIRFEDEELEAPFDIDSPCKIVHAEEGTRLVMGFVDAFEAPYGYYNRGLTLKEGSESPWPHVAFKIDSRYLEHTLTRDQILEDKNFHKAWKLLEETATKQLPQKLVELIEAAADTPEHREDHEQLCGHFFDWLESGESLRGDWLRGEWEKRPLIPTVDGEVVSLRDCRKRADKGRLFFAEERTLLTDKLPNDHLVIRSAADSPVRRLASRGAAADIERVSSWFILAAEASAQVTHEFTEQLSSIVRKMGGAVEWVGLRCFDEAEAGSDRLALFLEDRQVPTPVTELPRSSEQSLLEARHLVFNRSDERVDKLVDVSQREPEWAAYALIKLVLLEDGLRPELDSFLVTCAIERRKRRRGE
jgi:hypothetical protein